MSNCTNGHVEPGGREAGRGDYFANCFDYALRLCPVLRSQRSVEERGLGRSYATFGAAFYIFNAYLRIVLVFLSYV